MTCKTSYEFHHNFAKLADESGFSFNTHKPRVHIDWNKIKLLDIDSLVRDRKFVLIEQYLNQILDCVLESEFDVRILDEGVVKMFRLAQLTVEYQQFCRHYLDRSMLVLSDELKSVRQELERVKKSMRDKDEELKKIRKRSKNSQRQPLLYGTENIANILLQTLSNRGEIYPNTLMDSGSQYNKCNFCDKIFLNQIYLKGHIARRHPTKTEVPEKDTSDSTKIKENDKTEITELKRRLEEMESKLGNVTDKSIDNIRNGNDAKEDIGESSHTKDAEVSVNNEYYVLTKIEEWKKEESEKYNSELNNLKGQILETLNLYKEKEAQKCEKTNDEFIEQLRATIQEQKEELNILKRELENSKSRAINKNEVEDQIMFWSRKVEEQSNQYQQLLQNLTKVAREAQEARELAQAESVRASELQAQLQQLQATKAALNIKHVNKEGNTRLPPEERKNKGDVNSKVIDRRSLEELHRKAQTLLEMNTTDSSEYSNTSEILEVDSEKDISPIQPQPAERNFFASDNQKTKTYSNPSTKATKSLTITKLKKHKRKKEKQTSNSKSLSETQRSVSRSPVKVVRAKVTEEVNNRLTSIGIDPLRKGVKETSFRKIQAQLIKEQRAKTKQKSAYERVRNRILSYLDKKTRIEVEINDNSSEAKSPTNMPKQRRITSMISNVKRAISLVKSTEPDNARREREEMTRRAISLLKSPPGPATENQKRIGVPYGQELDSKDRVRKKVIRNLKTKEMRSEKQPKTKPIDTKEDTEQSTTTDTDTEHSDADDNINKIETVAVASMNKLIKSPVRRPSTATGVYTEKPVKDQNDLDRAQSETNLLRHFANKYTESNTNNTKATDLQTENVNTTVIKTKSENIIHIGPKGVLKNAPSTASLNKKKVIFDMDAIQMKSVSASPSQSLTEKSDLKEKYELGLVNLENDEWDISSIDDEPLKMSQPKNSIPSPKISSNIAELRQSIESQLSRRNTPSTLVVGGVDVLQGPAPRAPSIGGSNTSLGSSVFDDTDEAPPPLLRLNKAQIKDKDDSEIDISEFSLDVPVKEKKPVNH